MPDNPQSTDSRVHGKRWLALAAGPSMLSLVFNIANQKWGTYFPDWALFLMLLFSLACFIYWVFTTEFVQSRLREGFWDGRIIKPVPNEIGLTEAEIAKAETDLRDKNLADLHEKLAKPLIDPIQKDLKEIADLIAKLDTTKTRTVYEKNPGVSIHTILRIFNTNENRKKYLFDYGKQKSNRWSVFLDEEDVLTFQILDSKGKRYSLRAPGIPQDEFIFLSLECAIRSMSTVMRVLVDGQTLATRTIQERIHTQAFSPAGGMVGADLKAHQCLKFDMTTYLVFSETMTSLDMDRLVAGIRSHTAEHYMAFDATPMRVRRSQPFDLNALPGTSGPTLKMAGMNGDSVPRANILSDQN